MITFNKHAFIFYKKKMKEAGFPVEKYSDKQLKVFMSEFVLSIKEVKGYHTDPERENIVATNMIRDIRDKKLKDLLG